MATTKKPKITLERRDVVAAILKDRGDTLLVTGLGSATWDAAAAGDHPLNFYLWGAMGGAAMVGVASMRAAEIEDACGADAEPPRCSGGAANAARANELSEEGTALEIGGFSLLGIGGAALAKGIVILAVDTSNKPSPSTGAILVPVIGAHEGGLWVRAAF